MRRCQRAEWRRAASGWRKWRDRILDNLQPISERLIRAAEIGPGSHVLDAATGIGEPALTAARIVGSSGRVVGIDLTPDMLEIARERVAARECRNAVLHLVEDEKLALFADESFDAVLCRTGLMYMPDPVEALRAFHRVLKPKRKVSVAVWGSPERCQFFIVITRAIEQHFSRPLLPAPGIPGGPFAFPEPDQLEDAFRKAGFVEFEAETIEVVPFRAESAEEYWEIINDRNFFLLFSQLPDEKRPMIQRDLIRAVRDLFPLGNVGLTGEMIIGTARKPE